MQNDIKGLITEARNEIKKVIIGKDEVIDKVFMAVLSNGHVLLEDVPGVGKTTLALSFAKVLGLQPKRVQFTSDTMPSDIIGFSVYDKQSGKFAYKPGAVMTNLLLADEINRTSSKTQSALLEAMEERHVTVDGETHDLPSPFIVLATQNPIGSAGTQMLPNSQLDRFIIRISMGYPDFKSQVDILRDRQTTNPLTQIRSIMDSDTVISLIKAASEVHVEDEVYEYITELAQKTREHEMIQLGISPRGALAVCRMAKAYALVNGRDYAVPDDVAAVFGDVCGHRLALNSRARLAEKNEYDILRDIVAEVKMPNTKKLKI